jgi:dimethylaniline monooxygenase (N-oxide forming)
MSGQLGQAVHRGRMRVAVIGAGASGLTTAKCLAEEGLEPVVFEQSSDIGGVWQYTEGAVKTGIAYQSLKTNTSKRMMAFSDFPYPDTAPDFPSRAEVLQYLQAYADHFGLRQFITFDATVEQLEPAADGQWTVHFRIGAGPQTNDTFNGVIVASGLYHAPVYPQSPGSETFQGHILHSADYQGPAGFEGKHVVLAGVGASGADIAAEVSRVAAQVDISTRSGVWFLPHSIGGLPYDYQITRLSTLLPFRVRMTVFRQLVLNEYRRMGYTDAKIASALRLPVFDVWRARLTPGTPVLTQILAGAIRLRPAIARIEPNGVRFVDDTFVLADTIIACTGYALHFPFLSSSIAAVEGDVIDLYEQVFHPSRPNLAFVGLCIVTGPLFPVAEMQARWVSRVFAQTTTLPSAPDRLQAVQRQRQRHQQLQAHPMRVQLADYLDALAVRIGVRPRLLRHPRLIWRLLLGPLVAAQYRLDGAGKSDWAEEMVAGK